MWLANFGNCSLHWKNILHTLYQEHSDIFIISDTSGLPVLSSPGGSIKIPHSTADTIVELPTYRYMSISRTYTVDK